MGEITIVGLGPGPARFLTRAAWDAIAAAPVLYLRTARHPAVADLPGDGIRYSFDDVYETAESFTAVYETIVARLLQEAKDSPLCYAVPGDPAIGESTVTRLRAAAAEAGIPVTAIPGVSFVEPVLSVLAVDAFDGLQLYDAIDVAARHHPPFHPDAPVLLGQVYSRMLAGELKLVLMSLYPDEHPVQLIHAAGDVAEQVELIPLYAIDRSPHIDHMTSLYLPPLPGAASLATLAETVAILRAPGGCPWDQEQTPQSMRSGLLEETAEVLDALDAEDSRALAEELGDLLYHIVMQIQMATETEAFTLSDVIGGIDAKLKRRHPHVWGDWEVENTADVLRNWEALKREEKGEKKRPSSLLDNVPAALPALARSQKIQSRVAKIGFDWPDVAGVRTKVSEELAELEAADSAVERAAELGDVLFVLVNLARWLDVDAESALREANRRFAVRFRVVEQLAVAQDIDLAEADFEIMEQLWQQAKQQLANRRQSAKVKGK